MSAKVDWFAFSFPVIPQGDQPDTFESAVRGLMALAAPEAYGHLLSAEWFPTEFGRAPYSEGWTIQNTNVTIWCNPALTHATFEATGTGCEYLRSVGVFDDILKVGADRATRIDVAVDIFADIQPDEFVGAGHSGRMKASATLKSESGTTCYVGSPKSERFARVYRYAPPHPRSDAMRVEMVHRRDHAKAMAALVVQHGVERAATDAATAYNWQHEAWELRNGQRVQIDDGVTDARDAAGTIRWLLKQAAPAFQRLVREGAIADPEGFLLRHFMTDPAQTPN